MNQGATNSVSQTSVQRTLLRLGLLSRGLVPAPMLTAAYRQQGLEFGGQYGKWTSTEWQQIAFSDYFIYQQDNVKCHTAGSVRVGFEEPQEEFTVLPWPPNSPDLNPIENLWGYLDQIVHAMDLHPSNLARLAMVLESAGLNIPVNTFRNLIDSHPARLAAVRFAKCG
ncbi:transposable element Tcb1 transposase [Trichonephila clavipes]|nr:transposable element Tcb1 transposase [Trichonephila clavipes]